MIWDVCRALSTRLENWRLSVQVVSNSIYYAGESCTKKGNLLRQLFLLS